VRFFYIYKLLKGLISSRCGISNTSPHVETAQLNRETILFKGGPIAGGPKNRARIDFDTILRSEI